MKKISTNESKGITLIALVVTIIVLLILAGISIAMLTGNNGLLTKAALAKEAMRGGEVQEYINLALNENLIYKYTNGNEKTKNDVIDELRKRGKLTKEEEELLKDKNVINIGGIKVDFARTNIRRRSSRTMCRVLC